MATFWTSDPHWGHTNIIKYTNRPFKSVKEMDETLVKNWNSVVSSKDEIHCLGDFCYGRGTDVSYTEHILNQLNGRIHIYWGNHDKWAKRLKHKFASYKDYDEIEVQGQRMVLFHYALRTWHHESKGVWHLYGHSHNGLPPVGKSVDVGVDNPLWNYSPVSFSQLKAFMDKQPAILASKFENYIPNSGDDPDDRKGND